MADVTSENDEELRVEAIESIDALQHHALKYDALTARMDGTCFPIYHRFWIEEGAPIYLNNSIYLAGNRKLFFLFAWRGNDLVGVAPFQIIRRFFGLGNMNWLTFWGHASEVASLDNVTGDFIIPEHRDQIPCLTAFKKYLAGPGRMHWDVIKLSRFCSVSKTLAAFQTIFPEAIGTQEEDPGFMVELPDSWEALATYFKGKTVRNLRRSLRLLKENTNSYEFSVHEQIDDVLFEKMAKVHTSRQEELVAKGRHNRDAPFSNDDIKRIIRKLLDNASKKGMLRIYCLIIDKQMAAFGVVIANRDDAVCWFIAFDEQFQSFSPSRLVFQYIYTTEMERYGTKRVNLLLGYTRTKKELSTSAYGIWQYELPNEYAISSKLKRPLYGMLKACMLTLRRVLKRRI